MKVEPLCKLYYLPNEYVDKEHVAVEINCTGVCKELVPVVTFFDTSLLSAKMSQSSEWYPQSGWVDKMLVQDSNYDSTTDSWRSWKYFTVCQKQVDSRGAFDFKPTVKFTR